MAEGLAPAHLQKVSRVTARMFDGASLNLGARRRRHRGIDRRKLPLETERLQEGAQVEPVVVGRVVLSVIGRRERRHLVAVHRVVCQAPKTRQKIHNCARGKKKSKSLGLACIRS